MREEKPRMKRTEDIWLNPAAAYAMWIELWTAWCTAVLWWLPKPVLRPAGPGRPRKGMGRAGVQAVKPPCFTGQDHSNAAANGVIARQMMNGHGAG
jgi:hypothetical protein